MGRLKAERAERDWIGFGACNNGPTGRGMPSLSQLALIIY
jgi:hypothetical protein